MSVWKYYNPNPEGRRTDDCSIRALTKALGVDWDTAFAMVVAEAFEVKSILATDATWGNVLAKNGFRRYAVPNTCPLCYTAEDFALDHPKGVYTLGFGGHTATIRDGILYDSFDSSQSIPQFYWYRRY